MSPVVLDAVLVVLLVLAAWRGSGLGAGVLLMRTLGVVVGAWAGPEVARFLLPSRPTSSGVSTTEQVVTLVLLVLVVVVTSSAGLVVGTFAGQRWRSLRPAPHPVDASLGAMAAATLCAMGLSLGASLVRVAPLPAPTIGPVALTLERSQVLRGVEGVAPAAVRGVIPWLSGVLVANRLDHLGYLLQDGPPPAPPDPALARDPEVQRAAASVLKVTGVARACSRTQEGSAWVVAPRRVVTNAHVVAGVTRPWVSVPGSRPLPARAVVVDSRRDVAVLDVPQLKVAPLAVGRQLGTGASAAVAGFPLDGPYRVTPARVQDVATVAAVAPDKSIFHRVVYSLVAEVHPGSSGGPLLDLDGRVVGVIYARGVEQPGVGYALTMTTVEPVLAKARSARGPVSTGACTRS